MSQALSEEQVRHIFYVRLTQALHAAVAESIDKNGEDVHLIHILGQFKRFENAIEITAGSPQMRVTSYPE